MHGIIVDTRMPPLTISENAAADRRKPASVYMMAVVWYVHGIMLT